MRREAGTPDRNEASPELRERRGARWRTWGPGAVFLLCLALPRPGAGQQIASECELLEFRVITSRAVVAGAQVTWLGRPSLACPDGLRIRADSAVVYEETGRNELIGNVRFTTPERELRSRFADYFERDRRLFAWGDVHLRDRTRGTEVEGDTLLFLEAGPQRPEESLVVYGGRPRALLVPDAPEDGVDPLPEPFRVVANRLRFEGERFFWADGAVEVERGEMTAFADSLVYNRGSEELVLQRDARVVRGDVKAVGGLLNLAMGDGRLHSVRTRRDGRIETGDLVLTGEDVEVELDEEENVRTVTSRSVEGGERSTLVSDDVHLAGDQIVIEEAVDGGRVVRATGRARGETLSREGPSGDPEAALPDRDWIEGDEVVAQFAEVQPIDDPEMEPGETRYELVLLQATGNARTLYRSPPERQGEDPSEGDPVGDSPWDWAISYVLADRIVVHLVDGEVELLETEGNVRGIQLEPERRR
jgi:hypothetical protein